MRWATLGMCAAITVAGSGLAFGGAVQKPAPGRPPAAEKPAEPTEPSAPAAVEVHTSLNRTAVWVGDPIVWTVDLVCAPTVDVIADDLAGEKLMLNGLELLGSETERITNANGTLTHRVQYRLGAYEVAQEQLRVAPFKVRYYERRPGQRAEDIAPAGEAAIPGAVLAWRSTIPPGLDAIVLRENRAAEVAPAFLAWARPVGLTLIVISIAPVVVWAAAWIRERQRPRDWRPSLRASRKEARSGLTSLMAADTATEAERRTAYERLNDLIRRYVSETTGVPAQALTPDEITAGFSQRQGSQHALSALGEVLTECEQARYGPPEQLPTADRFRDSVGLVERLV